MVIKNIALSTVRFQIRNLLCLCMYLFYLCSFTNFDKANKFVFHFQRNKHRYNKPFFRCSRMEKEYKLCSSFAFFLHSYGVSAVLSVLLGDEMCRFFGIIWRHWQSFGSTFAKYVLSPNWAMLPLDVLAPLFSVTN